MPETNITLEIAITARDLTKYFGEFLAVDHINFEIRGGETFGFLGPNGAGKTTPSVCLPAY